jgi:hypothetical protein
MGLSLSSIFLVYTGCLDHAVFFITAAAFGALSLYGYTTKKDLSGMGHVPDHGPDRHHHRLDREHLPASSALQFAVSVIGVLVFAGLTAYDTQRIKTMYYEGDSADDCRPQGDHGRAEPVPQLHQHVHVPAAVPRQPRVTAGH